MTSCLLTDLSGLTPSSRTATTDLCSVAALLGSGFETGLFFRGMHRRLTALFVLHAGAPPSPLRRLLCLRLSGIFIERRDGSARVLSAANWSNSCLCSCSTQQKKGMLPRHMV